MTQQPHYPPPPYRPEVAGYYQPQYLDPADWSDRFTAYLLDGALLFAVFIGGSVVRAVVDRSDGDASIIVLVAAVLITALWNRIYLQCTSGQSLGKRIIRIQLVAEHNGLPPGLGRTVGRELLGFVLGRIPLLGLVWGLSPLWDSKRQAWHDAAARTLVVKLPKR